MDAEAMRCPECAASVVDGKDCWNQLGEITSWEWEDPELMAAHFLTVASYNLQHPAQFTDEAIAGLRDSLLEHLEKGTPVAVIRKRTARTYRGAVKVIRPLGERKNRLRLWPLTIDSVYGGGPDGAARRVHAWAEAVRSELRTEKGKTS